MSRVLVFWVLCVAWMFAAAVIVSQWLVGAPVSAVWGVVVFAGFVLCPVLIRSRMDNVLAD